MTEDNGNPGGDNDPNAWNDGMGREGQPTGEAVRLTPEQEQARKKRNLAIAWGLVAFIVLVFVITVARLSQNVANGAADAPVEPPAIEQSS